MAKILTDKELGEIIWKATHDENTIECADSYEHFLEALATLVCDHFGGVRGTIGKPDEDFSWTVAIRIDESVPADGGVYSDYDPDIQWKNGEEFDSQALKET